MAARNSYGLLPFEYYPGDGPVIASRFDKFSSHLASSSLRGRRGKPRRPAPALAGTTGKFEPSAVSTRFGGEPAPQLEVATLSSAGACRARNAPAEAFDLLAGDPGRLPRSDPEPEELVLFHVQELGLLSRRPGRPKAQRGVALEPHRRWPAWSTPSAVPERSGTPNTTCLHIFKSRHASTRNQPAELVSRPGQRQSCARSVCFGHGHPA